ncbi:DUF1615 domain-containing protein [Agrilutibacter solisilvae]|nr:DUF1615 domain-containing protein [Lysobacter solisilvae]
MLITACQPPAPRYQPTPEQVRAQIRRLLPSTLADRAGWAADIQSAFQLLELPPTTANLCAVLAVTEQESGYKADPPVEGLGRIARAEIERRARAKGVPALAVRGLLLIKAPDGRSYGDKLAAVRTERELSALYEELAARAPSFGQRLLERGNPVRTGGPMQVSIDYAQRQVRARPYPYPMAGTLRREVFSRRGGMYFGIAHLLKYPNTYTRHLYRFADFNAGHYASRNAAFQAAVSQASGIALSLDGDLVAHGSDAVGATEAAVRSLAGSLQLDHDEIRRALRQGGQFDFEKSDLYLRVFALAEKRAGRRLPRARLPGIRLDSPKITRRLTTEWFAQRVETRYRACEARAR